MTPTPAAMRAAQHVAAGWAVKSDGRNDLAAAIVIDRECRLPHQAQILTPALFISEATRGRDAAWQEISCRVSNQGTPRWQKP